MAPPNARSPEAVPRHRELRAPRPSRARTALLLLPALAAACKPVVREPRVLEPELRVVSMASEAARSRLWLGTENGLVSVATDTGDVRRFLPEDGRLAAARVETVLVDGKGDVWLGYGHARCDDAHCGVSRYAPADDTWHRFEQGAGGFVDGRVFRLAASPAGELHAGTNLGVTRHLPASDTWSGNHWVDFHDCRTPGAQCRPLWSYTVTGLAFSPAGDLWAAVNLMVIGISPKPGGVARRAAGRTDTWNMDDGLPSNQAARVAVAGDGVAWMCARDGIASLDESRGRWEIRSTAGCNDLLADGDTLRAATEAGALSFGPGDGSTSLEEPEGLPSNRVNALVRHGGALCFGTAAGVGCRDVATGAWTYPYGPRPPD